MKICYLSGGVGGAKLLHGLYRLQPQADLVAVVNTGDDFWHWGLFVSPDIDTVIYTLADLVDPARGWGRANDTYALLGAMQQLGQPDWFMLGDRDVATHMVRTAALKAGMTLTAITDDLSRRFGVGCRILPMCDGPRRTEIETADGAVLPFQDWLVKAKAAPLVRRVAYRGDDVSTPAVAAAIEGCDVVVIGPSNPYVSILTMLSLQGLGDRIAAKPIVAVSPIVNGLAVKGPLAAMLRSIDALAPSAAAALGHYVGLRAAVVQHGDGVGIKAERILETDTVMKTTADRERLAAEVIELAGNVL